MYIDIHECIENGTHLQDVDDDGYCNFCGEQISAEDLEECLVDSDECLIDNDGDAETDMEELRCDEKEGRT